MTTKEIRELSPVERVAKPPRSPRASSSISGLRKHTGQVEKTHELRSLRKDIARLETILRQKSKSTAAA